MWVDLLQQAVEGGSALIAIVDFPARVAQTAEQRMRNSAAPAEHLDDLG
jgi:hypothetical protein